MTDHIVYKNKAKLVKLPHRHLFNEKALPPEASLSTAKHFLCYKEEGMNIRKEAGSDPDL